MVSLRAFGVNDLKNIGRDSLLVYMIVIPPLMVVLVRLILPWLSTRVAEGFGFDLVPYYPMLLSFFFVLQLPLLFGMLVGLLILDERDDDTLTALRVTPISMTGYACYRGGVAVLLSTLYVIIALPLTGLMPPALFPAVIPVAILSGILATFFGLVIATFASNKVEGLALTKALGVFLLGPLAAYFIGSDWQLLLGVLPTYWPAKAFWVAGEGGNFWPYFFVGSRVQPGARGTAFETVSGENVLKLTDPPDSALRYTELFLYTHYHIICFWHYKQVLCFQYLIIERIYWHGAATVGKKGVLGIFMHYRAFVRPACVGVGAGSRYFDGGSGFCDRQVWVVVSMVYRAGIRGAGLVGSGQVCQGQVWRSRHATGVPYS